MAFLLFEDEHLLVVNKPPGWNTHSPDPFAGEGIYEWLKSRSPNRERLAIIHRLDKETSGLLLFTKSPEANRSLTRQFEQRSVRKVYHFLTDRTPIQTEWEVRSSLRRVGNRRISQSVGSGEEAETHFRLLKAGSGPALVAASPQTGRTHQIRVQAAESGCPVLGDALYGGSKFHRLCLHAAELSFEHPTEERSMDFKSPPDFASDVSFTLRMTSALTDETDSCQLIHGAADGWPGFYLDKIGDYLLAQSERELTSAQKEKVRQLSGALKSRGAGHKLLTRHVRFKQKEEAGAQPLFGEPLPDKTSIMENGMRYVIRFNEGYSVGLFLDQRENRRKILRGWAGPQFPLPQRGSVLNAFAYTCAFSVCAAQAGAQTVSLDLSKKYLEWGKENFRANGLSPEKHEFVYGDAFDWFRRYAKKGRLFDLVFLDPPTFSQSKESGVFQAEKDFVRLTRAALPLIHPGGVLFASSNAARLAPAEFVRTVEQAVSEGGRAVTRSLYSPQPPDFPITREEPAYFKSVWVKVR